MYRFYTTKEEVLAIPVVDLIQIFDIVDVGDGRIGVRVNKGKLPDAVRAGIVERKAEVLAYFKEKRDRKALTQHSYDIIPGLKEIEEARAEWAKYREQRERYLDEESYVWPQKPTTDLDSLYEKYPRASAFVKAQSWAGAAHTVKASAGREAVDSILLDVDGANYEAIIAEMEKKWNDYVMEHMWD